jgi:protein SFI1
MRQVLNHWLQATRRKRSLAEREEELNRAVLSQAYDKWRDKFLENNLRPAVRFSVSLLFKISHFLDIKELDVLLQSQTNLLFKMFRIWEARTPVSSLQRV